MDSRLILAALVVPPFAACTLFPNLGDLETADASPDSVQNPTDAAADAPVDALNTDALGLLAEWPFDEDAGLTAHDITGRGHDGTLVGGKWIAGHSGNALLFNGTSDMVVVPASADFDRPAGASFSITAWVYRVGDFSHDVFLSSSYGASSAAYGIEAQSDTLVNYWDGVAHIATADASFGASVWHHTAVVVETGTLARTYSDGKLVGSGVADNTPRTCTQLLLGTSNYGDYFPGALDSLRFYGRALSDAEVASDMNR